MNGYMGVSAGSDQATTMGCRVAHKQSVFKNMVCTGLEDLIICVR